MLHTTSLIEATTLKQSTESSSDTDKQLYIE